jgi:hypothetical protein
MANPNELKPCPFCGSPAQITWADDKSTCFVSCSVEGEGCNAVAMSAILPYSKAVESWNTRAADKPAGLPRMPERPAATFQVRVREWMLVCFGEAIAADVVERNHRFIEEALELVQACGCTESEAHQLVDYVFNRPIGEINQEVGGVMVTLAALCGTHFIDLSGAAETELTRIWTKVEQIREKQANKPKHSPLPA